MESGADDYLKKPIKPNVLLSKVESLFRRIQTQNNDNVQGNDLIIDRDKFHVTYKGNNIVLARKEFELLVCWHPNPVKFF